MVRQSMHIEIVCCYARFVDSLSSNCYTHTHSWKRFKYVYISALQLQWNRKQVNGTMFPLVEYMLISGFVALNADRNVNCVRIEAERQRDGDAMRLSWMTCLWELLMENRWLRCFRLKRFLRRNVPIILHLCASQVIIKSNEARICTKMSE